MDLLMKGKRDIYIYILYNVQEITSENVKNQRYYTFFLSVVYVLLVGLYKYIY